VVALASTSQTTSSASTRDLHLQSPLVISTRDLHPRSPPAISTRVISTRVISDGHCRRSALAADGEAFAEGERLAGGRWFTAVAGVRHRMNSLPEFRSTNRAAERVYDVH